MTDTKMCTDRIFHRVHRGGEEMKNDLPNWIQRAIDSQVWKNSINPGTGKPFNDLGSWLIAGYPLGPGMGRGEFAITYDECIQLCGNRPSLKDLLVRHRPVRGKGRPTKEQAENVAISNNKTGRLSGTTSRAYIEQRLSRDFPQVWEKYLAGEFASARQAAIAAGFIKDTHDPLMRMKAYWKKASKKQRAAFMKWAQNAE